MELPYNKKRYSCGDILMCKINCTDGSINWLNILPKFQAEEQVIEYTFKVKKIGFSVYSGTGENRPFYSGFITLPYKENLYLIFNDHKKNSEVLHYTDPYTGLFGELRSSDCDIVFLNTINGRYTRKVIYNHKDIETVTMPRIGSVINNELYLLGISERMLKKTKFALAKLAIQ